MKKLSIAFLTLVLVSACGGGSSKSDSGSSGGASGGNTAPSIQLTDNTFTVAEGETAISTISATDAEGDSISFTLIGDDAGVVSIGSTSGALSFNAVTDYEAPADADGDNTYEVTVRAYDGSAADARDILISVTNVVEAPVITSPASYEVLENETLVGPVTVSDAEGTVTYGISGADANLFAISSAGILAFKAAPDFETPGSAAGSNTYSLTVEATNSGGTASKAVTVVVKDVEENSLPTDLFISEYVEGSSNNKYIEIFNGTGETVNLDAYAVARCGNDCADGEHEYWDTFPAGTTLVDGAVYTMCHTSYVGVANCDQAETGIGYWNGNDALKLVKGTETSYTDIDVIGVFTAESADYWSVCGVENGLQEHTIIKKERVEGNTDWAASAGTNANDCDWIVKEQDDFTDFGKHCWNSNGDDAVTINNASGAVSVAENQTAVATVSTSVSGFCGDITLALSGTDAELFAEANGVVTFKTAPDFEAPSDANTDNVYNFTVTATAGEATDTLDMVVTVTNVTGGNLDFSEAFDGAVYNETDSSFTHPTEGAQSWAGFANMNKELYPITFAEAKKVTFTGAAPQGDVQVKFQFERLPYGTNGDGAESTKPLYLTEAVKIVGATEASYSVKVPSQGDKTFSSVILYIVDKDLPAVMKNIKIEDISPFADFGGFDGATRDGDTFTFPSTAQSWAGFGNNNTDLYPMTLGNGAAITFKGSAVDADVELKFKFERLPYGTNGDGAASTLPAYDTTSTVVSGTTEKEYTICVPAQDAANTYSSFLMYLVTQDAGVVVKDVKVTPYETAVTECPSGYLEPTWNTFDGTSVENDVYTWPSSAASWAGFSNGNEDIYYIDGATLEKITFNGSVPDGGEGIVRFRFEDEPYPNVGTFYDVPTLTTVSGATVKEYEVPLTAQGDTDFNSFLMYLNTRDVGVKITDIKLYAEKAAVDPDKCGNRGDASTGLADICDGFGGAQYVEEDSSYFMPTPNGNDVLDWGGFANKDESLYPLDLTNGAVVTFDAWTKDDDVTVEFRFEDKAGGGGAIIARASKAVSGTTKTTYTVNIPAPTGDTKASNNFLMYLLTYDKMVYVQNVYVVPNAAN